VDHVDGEQRDSGVRASAGWCSTSEVAHSAANQLKLEGFSYTWHEVRNNLTESKETVPRGSVSQVSIYFHSVDKITAHCWSLQCMNAVVPAEMFAYNGIQ
jgi:hypothetical protein